MAGFNKEDLKPIKSYKALVGLMIKRAKGYARGARHPMAFKKKKKFVISKVKPKFKVDGSVETGYTAMSIAIEPRQYAKTYGFKMLSMVWTDGSFAVCFTYRGLKPKTSLFHKPSVATQSRIEQQLYDGVTLSKTSYNELKSSVDIYNSQENALTAEIDEAHLELSFMEKLRPKKNL